MSRVVNLRKNVLITGRIDDDDSVSFTKEINNVTFIPDEVIVKMITYNTFSALPEYDDPDVIPPSAYNRVISIFTDLVDDGYIGSMTDVGTSCPGLTFTIKRPVIGVYKFELFDVNRSPYNFKCDIMIHLEFVQYHSGKTH